MLNLSKFVSLAFKFQIFDLSKFVSLAYCCKMQAHSTMRGKRPKIIDVKLPPGTSGNPGFKKKIFVISLTNLQPMMVRPLQAGVRRPSTAMHI